MKKFLKLIALVLTIAMAACCFAACSKDKSNETENNAEAPEADNVLTVATNAEFPPFEYIENGEVVGADVAKKALAKGIEGVVFDRGGFLFHGRVEALANAAREAGLQF